MSAPPTPARAAQVRRGAALGAYRQPPPQRCNLFTRIVNPHFPNREGHSCGMAGITSPVTLDRVRGALWGELSGPSGARRRRRSAARVAAMAPPRRLPPPPPPPQRCQSACFIEGAVCLLQAYTSRTHCRCPCTGERSIALILQPCLGACRSFGSSGNRACLHAARCMVPCPALMPAGSSPPAPLAPSFWPAALLLNLPLPPSLSSCRYYDVRALQRDYGRITTYQAPKERHPGG